MTAPPTTIAATSTLAMVLTAEARGFGTADLLDASGLTRDILEDPDARLPGPVVLGLWSALRERTGDPVLQLVAPSSLPFGAYRVIDYLVGASPTVGEGMLRFARYFRLIAEGVVLCVEEREEGQTLSLTMADGGPVPPVYVDYVFAALVSRVRMRIRPSLTVRRVDLRQPEPLAAEAYRACFRAPVRFGAAADRLCFDRAEWTAPMDTADPALADLLEEHARILAERLPAGVGAFPEEVQRTIASLLPEGSAEAVAHALHMSVRTLQRKLVANGTTFREMVDAVRERLAEEYLADPSVATTAVAFLLGFSEQSSFNRAFRRWTGESPGRWRRRARASSAPTRFTPRAR